LGVQWFYQIYHGFSIYLIIHVCFSLYGFIIILANILKPHGLSETAHLHLPQSGGAPAMFVG